MQVITIIIFLSSLFIAILADDSSETICRSSEKCIRTQNCKPAIQQIRKKRFHSFTRCGFEGRYEMICCSEWGAKSKEVCERWKKTLPSDTPQPQIANGKSVGNGDYPHMVALGFYNEMDHLYHFNCGGSIISERYILTAAHCIANIDRNKAKIVRIGTIEVPETVERPDPAVDYNVEEVHVHKYIRKTKLNDIALVKLEKTLSWTDFIRPACLYLKGDDPEKLYVTGWGNLGLGLSRSIILQKAALKPIVLSECNVTHFLRNKKALHDTQICAADRKMDSCKGDSGGPLQSPEPNSDIFAIVGIVSYGTGCGSKYPSIYTRVYSYLDWIENIVWP